MLEFHQTAAGFAGHRRDREAASEHQELRPGRRGTHHSGFWLRGERRIILMRTRTLPTADLEKMGELQQEDGRDLGLALADAGLGEGIDLVIEQAVKCGESVRLSRVNRLKYHLGCITAAAFGAAMKAESQYRYDGDPRVQEMARRRGIFWRGVGGASMAARQRLALALAKCRRSRRLNSSKGGLK